jgi:hypothetical protein
MGVSAAGTAVKRAFERGSETKSSVTFDTPIMNSARETKSEAAIASALEDSDIQRIKSVLETRRKMFLVTALESARHAAIKNNELYVEFAPEARHLRDMLAKSENSKILREACNEVRDKDTGVRIVIKEADATGNSQDSKEDVAAREKQSLRQVAEQHPVVQQLLRTFRGEVVDVRRVESE